MLKSLFAWLFTFVFAFSLGTNVHNDKPADSELEQKVRDHMDVIVDESAAMVDDVLEEVRGNEYVQNAEAFVDDVNEIIDNTREDIRAHFGREDDEDAEAEETEEAEADEADTEDAEAETDEADEAEAEPEAPEDAEADADAETAEADD